MKKILIFLTIFNLFVCSNLSGFSQLQDLKRYTNKYMELPEPDNEDLLNPDYTSFQMKYLKSGAWDNFLKLVGLKAPYWEVKNFYSLLNKIVENRKSGDFIYKFSPKPGSKFIIWGELHSAFHSLTRCLFQLEAQGIIDSNLKIIKKDHYFIFNGNLVDRSPYILETLHLICRLEEQNPGKVFYMRGAHESEEYWYNYGLKRELDVKTSSLSVIEKKTLNDNINYLFNSLPIALFLKVQDKNNFVCISPYGINSKQSQEKYIADFLNYKQTSGALLGLDLKQAEISSSNVNIEAIIKGLDRKATYQSTFGLSSLLPDHGATAWSVLSAPILPYQRLYDFFYDSFAILEVGKTIYDWTITSVTQDSRKMGGFSDISYYLVSGQATTLPKSIGAITIGCSADTKTQTSVVRNESIDGMFMRINRENKNGGINGKYIKLVILNDGYDPDQARANIKTLAKRYKTDITLCSYGSVPLTGYLDLVEKGEVLVLFPITGAVEFRDPKYKHIINYRPSYKKEGRVLADYVFKKLKSNRLAVFYPSDLSGEAILEGVKDIVGTNKDRKIEEIPFASSTDNFSVQVGNFLNFDPDATIFCSAAASTQEFIRQLDINNLVGKKLLGGSDLANNIFEDFLKSKGLGFDLTQIMPNTQWTNLKIVKNFDQDCIGYGFVSDGYTLEGFIGAAIFIDVLKKLDGHLDQTKIIQTIENMKNYKLDGLDLTFSPTIRSFETPVYIKTQRGEWIKWKITEPKQESKKEISQKDKENKK